METLIQWIKSNDLDNLRKYIRSLSNINSILIYDQKVDFNLLHIISSIDDSYRDDTLKCLLDENDKIIDKPKLKINQKSGPGNDYWTACHIACSYGYLSTLEILLNYGADPDILDKNGYDALSIASAFDQYRCIDFLRRMNSKTSFSKDDLNKSCDTVFYSFKDNSSTSYCFLVNKMDAKLQTSGQSNNTFDATFKTSNDTFSKDMKIISKSNNSRSHKPIASASKVLDKHRKEYENTRILNSTFIKEYNNNQPNLTKSLNKTAILNEFRKDSNSKVIISKSVDNKHRDDRASVINEPSNVIKNLRDNFRDCKIDQTSSDESMEPFETTISTIALDENKELYIDNEFSVTLINETKSGLLNQIFETSDLDSSDNSNDLLDDLLTETANKSLDSTLKDEDIQDGNTFSNCFKINTNQHKNYDTLTDDQLFDELIKQGFRPGPINSNTRSVYLRKLDELIGQNNKLNNKTKKISNAKLNNEIKLLNCNEKSDSLLMFSKPLRELMNGKFDFNKARLIEIEFVQSFDNERASSKKFFNYLLLDPRVTQNLCKKALEVNPELANQLNFLPKSTKNQFNHQINVELFKLFILAIFYIGKGQGNRPYMHFYDAIKLEQNQTSIVTKKQSNIKKLNKINEIWNSGHGVISLHCFQNVSSIESLTRECYMIDAIGIKLLTNIRIGQNMIKHLKWTQYKKDMLGVYLLYKAYNVLLVNGERQIRRADI